jgi:hypothetical protein
MSITASSNRVSAAAVYAAAFIARTRNRADAAGAFAAPPEFLGSRVSMGEPAYTSGKNLSMPVAVTSPKWWRPNKVFVSIANLKGSPAHWNWHSKSCHKSWSME